MFYVTSQVTGIQQGGKRVKSYVSRETWTDFVKIMRETS